MLHIIPLLTGFNRLQGRAPGKRKGEEGRGKLKGSQEGKGEKGKGRGVVPHPKQKSDCATVFCY